MFARSRQFYVFANIFPIVHFSFIFQWCHLLKWRLLNFVGMDSPFSTVVAIPITITTMFFFSLLLLFYNFGWLWITWNGFIFLHYNILFCIMFLLLLIFWLQWNVWYSFIFHFPFSKVLFIFTYIWVCSCVCMSM